MRKIFIIKENIRLNSVDTDQLTFDETSSSGSRSLFQILLLKKLKKFVPKASKLV